MLSDLENVHSSKNFQKRYDTINNMIKRMKSTTLLLNINWKTHCDKCYCYQQLEKLSKSLNVTKSLKQK
jgi:hypothetical protein